VNECTKRWLWITIVPCAFKNVEERNLKVFSIKKWYMFEETDMCQSITWCHINMYDFYVSVKIYTKKRYCH
jgi:hypothetical protein